MAYTKPQHWKKEESKQLSGDGSHIKFIDLRFERWQFVRLSELCWGKAGGVCKAPTKEERRKRKAKRRGRSDQVYCS